MLIKTNLPLSLQVIIGVALGTLLGVLFGTETYLWGLLKNETLGQFGMLVIRLLKTLATPLIFLAILDADVSILPDNLRDKNLFKTGQGYRKDLPEDSIKELIKFFEDNCEKIGMHGYPCCPLDDITRRA